MTHLPPPWARDMPWTVVPTTPPQPWRPDLALAALNAGYIGPTTTPPASAPTVTPSGRILRPGLWGKR
jgi:hypothetical protein